MTFVKCIKDMARVLLCRALMRAQFSVEEIKERGLSCPRYLTVAVKRR